MSDDTTNYEQTIEPIRARVSRPAEATDRRVDAVGRGLDHRVWFLVAGVGLAVGLGAVFFVLPRIVEDQAQATVDQPAEAVSAPIDLTPQLTPEQVAELEREIQRDLARLLTQQDSLEEYSVEDWGDDDWRRYLELSRAGDDAYLEDDYQAAADAYAEALRLGEQLLGRQSEIVANALADGAEQLKDGNWTEALRQYNTVLGIEPSNPGAQRGKRRAERLPEVLELMQRGDMHERDGRLPDAIADYQAALAIDGDWEPARAAVARARGNLSRYEYEQALSRAYAALSENAYRDAIEHFNASLAIRPDSVDAREGLYQAEEGLRLGQIALAEIRALAFERRELWGEAIEQYRNALDTDPTLQYAIQGLARSQQRQDLEVKIVNIIENPRLLFEDHMLAAATELLDTAEAIPDKGQRIDEQIADLTRLIGLASTPLRVVLESDALTEVTVFRLGTLGTFSSKEIELRPGDYTAIGSRNGYRDVRTSFTVLPGRELEPIRIVCVEPI